MSIFQGLVSIPEIRPAFNVGCGLDIPTGTYHLGEFGQSILCAGLSAILSVSGPPNSFKSVIMLHLHLTVADRIEQYVCSIYDSEVSMKYSRLNQLAKKFDNINKVIHGDPNLTPDQIRFMITSAADEFGDIYFEKITDYAKARTKGKTAKLKTPFIDSKGISIDIFSPIGSLIDSLSNFEVTAHVENIIDKNNLGESGNNIYHMKSANAKKLLLMRLPHLTQNGGIYFTMTAHIGNEFNLDPMAPKKHRLSHSKKGSVTTGVTKEFEFINNAIYEIFDASPCNNKEFRTGVLYPILPSDKDEDCTDLMKIHLKLTRNKDGLTGAVVDMIVSQREGVLPHLSAFHNIKEDDRFGLQGNNVTYALNLVPDINLSRTTVRAKIDENANLRRALEITYDLQQMKTLWDTLPYELMCTPEELYNDLITLGYDWGILLNTRGWWCFKESDKDNLPYLSTMDLLKMRKGMYHPFWLEDDKRTFRKKLVIDKVTHEIKHSLLV